MVIGIQAFLERVQFREGHRKQNIKNILAEGAVWVQTQRLRRVKIVELSMKNSVKRQRGKSKPPRALGARVVKLSLQQSHPKSSYKPSKTLPLMSSATGCSKPIVSSARTGLKTKAGPMLQEWTQDISNHTWINMPHVPRIHLSSVWRARCLPSRVGWLHSKCPWRMTPVSCCLPEHTLERLTGDLVWTKLS